VTFAIAAVGLLALADLRGPRASTAPARSPRASGRTPRRVGGAGRAPSTFVLRKDGSLWFTVGSPGGPTIINTALCVITNVVTTA